MDWHGVTFTQGVLLWVGTAFTAIGWYTGLRSLRLKRGGVPAAGVIREMRRQGRSNLPVFAFPTPDGQTHVVASNMSGVPAMFKVGEAVPVLYDPENPSRAQIDTFGQMWLGPLLFGGGGPVILIVVIVQLLERGR